MVYIIKNLKNKLKLDFMPKDKQGYWATGIYSISRRQHIRRQHHLHYHFSLLTDFTPSLYLEPFGNSS